MITIPIRTIDDALAAVDRMLADARRTLNSDLIGAVEAGDLTDNYDDVMAFLDDHFAEQRQDMHAQVLAILRPH